MDQARFCPKCGHALNHDERFCPNCGYDCGGKEAKEAQREEDRYRKERKRNDRDRSFHSNTALLALILGVLSLLQDPIIGVVAIILGNKERKVDSYARIGFILGIVSLVISLVLYPLEAYILLQYYSSLIPKDSSSSGELLSLLATGASLL